MKNKLEAVAELAVKEGLERVEARMEEEDIPKFIPARKKSKGMNATWYEGPKKAMVFKTGPKGLGYYREVGPGK